MIKILGFSRVAAKFANHLTRPSSLKSFEFYCESRTMTSKLVMQLLRDDSIKLDCISHDEIFLKGEGALIQGTFKSLNLMYVHVLCS